MDGFFWAEDGIRWFGRSGGGEGDERWQVMVWRWMVMGWFWYGDVGDCESDNDLCYVGDVVDVDSDNGLLVISAIV